MRMSARRGVLVASIAALVLSLVVDAADARKRVRPRASNAAASSSSDEMGGGKYAAYVLDDNTGRVLFARNEDAPRHPASLTKMMTLYCLFEDLERGKVKLDTDFQVSVKASQQAPSKLGLRPGQTIEVEDAIKALVTRSANDVAVVIAENLGGTESDFAERMTRTARKIGMNGTTFYNASGLPDMRQITTAHDMVVLGSALSERFPTYYRYFQTRAFEYKGEVIGNHNRLLGRIDGIDGIKTGYTQASGFNLVSSLRRDGKHLVAAVMGGPTGGARDRHMAKLLETYVSQASGGGKNASVMASAAKADAQPRKVAVVAPIKITADEDAPQKPSVERGAAVAMARAVLSPDMMQRPVAASAGAPMVIAPSRGPDPVAVQPQAAPQPVAAQPQPQKPIAFGPSTDALPPKNTQRLPSLEDPKPETRVKSLADATVSSKDVTDLLQTASVSPKLQPQGKVVASRDVAARDIETPQKGLPRVPANVAAQSGWLIQIGAVDREADAKALLNKAQGKVGPALKGRSAFTEAVGKGSGTLYRARFSGFADQVAANAACSALKKKDFSCLALKQ